MRIAAVSSKKITAEDNRRRGTEKKGRKRSGKNGVSWKKTRQPQGTNREGKKNLGKFYREKWE